MTNAHLCKIYSSCSRIAYFQFTYLSCLWQVIALQNYIIPISSFYVTWTFIEDMIFVLVILLLQVYDSFLLCASKLAYIFILRYLDFCSGCFFVPWSFTTASFSYIFSACSWIAYFKFTSLRQVLPQHYRMKLKVSLDLMLPGLFVLDLRMFRL